MRIQRKWLYVYFQRGFPSVIYSDNGTNFLAANKASVEAIGSKDNLSKIVVSLEKTHSISQMRIISYSEKWNFTGRNVVNSFSWNLTMHQLETADSVVERPPQRRSSDSFLNSLFGSTVSFTKIRSSKFRPEKTIKIKLYADQFWIRSLRKYLLTLHTRETLQKDQSRLKENNLVLIIDENMPGIFGERVWLFAYYLVVTRKYESWNRVQKAADIRPRNKLVKFA